MSPTMNTTLGAIYLAAAAVLMIAVSIENIFTAKKTGAKIGFILWALASSATFGVSLYSLAETALNFLARVR